MLRYCPTDGCNNKIPYHRTYCTECIVVKRLERQRLKLPANCKDALAWDKKSNTVTLDLFQAVENSSKCKLPNCDKSAIAICQFSAMCGMWTGCERLVCSGHVNKYLKKIKHKKRHRVNLNNEMYYIDYQCRCQSCVNKCYSKISMVLFFLSVLVFFVIVVSAAISKTNS